MMQKSDRVKVAIKAAAWRELKFLAASLVVICLWLFLAGGANVS